jgi:hypothetical protein
MDRDALVAAQRDTLWVISLRTKLLHARSGQQLAAARLLYARSRATVARAARLERLYDRTTAEASRHGKVIPLRRRSRRG